MNVFEHFPKISEDHKRLPKTFEEDMKIFRLHSKKLISSVTAEVNPGFAISVTAPYSAPGCNGLYGEVEPVRATFSKFRYNRIISQVENDIGKDGKSFIKVFQRALIKILEQTQLLAVSLCLFTT